eukprot:218399_1
MFKAAETLSRYQLDKLLIYGYIRNNITNTKMDDNTTTEIIRFYHDSFWSNKRGTDIVRTDTYIERIEDNDDGIHVAYGSQIVEKNGIHEWTLKIEKISRSFAIIIGVSSRTIHLNDAFIETTYPHYCLKSDGRRIASGYVWKDYPCQLAINDIIIVRLNLNKRELSYVKNGNELGVAYKDIDISVSYRLAVSFYEDGNRVEMISYRQK